MRRRFLWVAKLFLPLIVSRLIFSYCIKLRTKYSPITNNMPNKLNASPSLRCNNSQIFAKMRSMRVQMLSRRAVKVASPTKRMEKIRCARDAARNLPLWRFDRALDLQRCCVYCHDAFQQRRDFPYLDRSCLLFFNHSFTHLLSFFLSISVSYCVLLRFSLSLSLNCCRQALITIVFA